MMEAIGDRRKRVAFECHIRTNMAMATFLMQYRVVDGLMCWLQVYCKLMERHALQNALQTHEMPYM